jgi:hypothetical protein
MAIELIYGLSCTFPQCPPASTIDGYGKKQQRFQRVEIPESFDDLEYDEDGNPIYEESHIEFIKREWDRVTNGYWFFNKGTPTYITGDYYFYLNFWALESGSNPEYREADRKFFLFYNECLHDPNILGIIRVKKRREGATSQASCIITKAATAAENVRCGIISKTGKDAEDLFQNMVVYGFRAMPSFLQPRTDGSEDPKKKLTFVKPTKKKTVKKGLFNRREGLNSFIEWRNTALNSFDSGRWSRLVIDECFGKGTKILCEGMVFRNIEDIKVGDVVIVEGGKHVAVKNTFYGHDNLYKIHQPYSEDYVVNSKHKLYLEQRGRTPSIKDDGIKIISAPEAMNIKGYRKRVTYGLRSSGIEFNKKDVKVDPYILGAWLGDGFSGRFEFIVNKEDDLEILDYIISYADYIGAKHYFTEVKNSKKCTRVSIRNTERIGSKSVNHANDSLKYYNLIDNKHIPLDYLTNSKEVRLQLLAGIIDTDGFLTRACSYKIAMSRHNLVMEIQTLARSLGFSVSNIKERKTNFNTNAYEISISGDLQNIPCKVKRKSLLGYEKQYAFRRNKISITECGYGEYFGIEVDSSIQEDKRLILGDFTISMNCSKWPTEIPIQDYWNIAKKTLTEGAKKVGFSLMISTVNPPNSGGQEFKKLWDDSDQFRYGRNTPSRLVRYFLPANEGYAGFIDDWGFSKSEEAKEHILEERKRSKQDQDIRDYPLSEIEAFKFNDVDCHFNLDNIEKQEYYLKENSIPLRKGRLYIDGENKVQFSDDSAGSWVIYKLPKNPNNFIIKNGVMYPGASATYGAGCDPFRHNIVSGDGSMASAWWGEKLDITNEDDTGLPVAWYYGRPKMKDLLWKEMLMGAMYFGCPVTIEKDAGDDYYPYFQKGNVMEVNCLPMLGKKPDAVINPDRKAKTNFLDRGVASADAFALSRQLEYCINYVEHHCYKIYYPELLEELKRYRHDNRTKFDTVVSFMIMLLTMTGQNKANAVAKRKQPMIESYSADIFKWV